MTVRFSNQLVAELIQPFWSASLPLSLGRWSDPGQRSPVRPGPIDV